MKRRIERAQLPDPATLRELLADQASELGDGAVVVDADAQGATGVDLLMVDGNGRPIFVDVVTEGEEGIPTRVFEHLAWIERNGRLFLRAYGKDGVREGRAPRIIFVAERFPGGVLRALSALADTPVTLLRAEYLLIDGEGELLLEEVASTVGDVREPAGETDAASARGSGSEASRDLTFEQEDTRDESASVEPARPVEPVPSSRLEDGIESESVQGLLGLFKSGVDGLDARIVETESDGGVRFEIAGRTLAKVSVSPGSFTVMPGERAANPIVVSDRVSLERALNAVVSLFVREEGHVQAAVPAPEETLEESERGELVGIWGTGLSGERES